MKTLKMYADDLIDRQKGALPPDPVADRHIMRAVALLLRLIGQHVSSFVPQVPNPDHDASGCIGSPPARCSRP